MAWRKVDDASSDHDVAEVTAWLRMVIAWIGDTGLIAVVDLGSVDRPDGTPALSPERRRLWPVRTGRPAA